MGARTFQELIVWQKAHDLVLKTYKLTKKFPVDERFGLTSQMRRSVCSAATNIVEGYARGGKKEFFHFLVMSNASLEETKYHLILSRDLGYLTPVETENMIYMCEEVGRILFAFRNKLKVPVLH